MTLTHINDDKYTERRKRMKMNPLFTPEQFDVHVKE